MFHSSPKNQLFVGLCFQNPAQPWPRGSRRRLFEVGIVPHDLEKQANIKMMKGNYGWEKPYACLMTASGSLLDGTFNHAWRGIVVLWFVLWVTYDDWF